MISLAQIQNDFTPLNEKDIIKLMDYTNNIMHR